MELNEIIKTDEDRVFILDNECFIIFTGNDLNDEKIEYFKKIVLKHTYDSKRRFLITSIVLGILGFLGMYLNTMIYFSKLLFIFRYKEIIKVLKR